MKDSNPPVIELRGVCFRYNKLQDAISSISFKVHEGTVLGVLGPNGGGKSTLLKIIVGLLQPYKGDLRFYGNVVKEPKDIPRTKMAYVAQADILDTPLPLSAKDVIELGRLAATDKNYLKVEEAMDIVGLHKPPNWLIRNMSGGERQRVLLAKALMNKPELVIMDEPTKGLDSRGQDRLLSLVEHVRTTHNAAIILVDHNINQVIKHCDNILCLNGGHHWHGAKKLIKRKTLEGVYQCELDHLHID